jgi:hypothetical protein
MLQGTVGDAVQSTRRDAALARLPPTLALLLRAAALLSGFAVFFTRPSRLFDADSYLHLALARTIAAHGFVDHLEWARFSTLGHAYGDKELLFHVLLVPFVKLGDAELGGKLALALLCAAIALSLWELGTRALGRWGFLIPILVFGSGSFMLRAIRLRPELLSLLLAIWIVWALAERRYIIAAGLAFAFSFAHTAFHSLLGLALLFFAWQRGSERRWEWQLPAAVAGGIAIGVLLHPQFPHNLSVFWVQNVEFFRLKDRLDIGGEFQPHTVTGLLQLDGLFWLGLLALAATAARPASERKDPSHPSRRMASFCWIATAAFGALFLQMGRFATLAIPFAALACSFELAARGPLTNRVHLINGRTLPGAAVLGVIAALSCANALAIAFINWRMAGSFDPTVRRELEQLARQLPAGANVAANWDDAELYAFHAPHSRYLNVYDPVFMAVGDPMRHAVWSDVLAGALPDVPAAISEVLESEYLAFSVGSHPELERRLANDPRAQLLHRGRHALFRIQRGDPHFFTRWVVETRSKATIQTQPLADGRAYVDARPFLVDGCATFRRSEIATQPRRQLLELAAWGPTTFFIDGEQRLQLAAASFAHLGEGPALAIRLEPGTQRWSVHTCAQAGQAGFYLVDRGAK